jgi:hypothetical protein
MYNRDTKSKDIIMRFSKLSVGVDYLVNMFESTKDVITTYLKNDEIEANDVKYIVDDILSIYDTKYDYDRGSEYTLDHLKDAQKTLTQLNSIFPNIKLLKYTPTSFDSKSIDILNMFSQVIYGNSEFRSTADFREYDAIKGQMMTDYNEIIQDSSKNPTHLNPKDSETSVDPINLNPNLKLPKWIANLRNIDYRKIFIVVKNLYAIHKNYIKVLQPEVMELAHITMKYIGESKDYNKYKNYWINLDRNIHILKEISDSIEVLLIPTNSGTTTDYLYYPMIQTKKKLEDNTYKYGIKSDEYNKFKDPSDPTNNTKNAAYYSGVGSRVYPKTTTI